MLPEAGLFTTDLVNPADKAAGHEVEYYSSILNKWGIYHVQSGLYLQVGNIEEKNWILDISVIHSQLCSFFEKIAPVLKSNGVSFRIAADSVIARRLYSADFGYEQLGKIISIYPGTPAEALKLAKTLIPLTKDIRGAEIPTDYHLGGNLYVRYSDQLNIPFSFPKGQPWPFNEIRKALKIKQTKVLKNSYLRIQVIKADVKGNVFKAIDLRKWWALKFNICAVKEGKKDMYMDESGRTIKERLLFQFQIVQDLAGIIPSPKAIDYFEHHGNSYLVMEYVEGRQLQELRSELAENKCWFQLNLEKRQLVLNRLRKILFFVDRMHKKGYVHRDITPVNFLVDQSENIYFIDLELCYHKKYFNGALPFNYGTPGFMSPEQLHESEPTSKEDSYAIGALMITLLAGLHPSKVDTKDKPRLREKMEFFLRDEILADLIVSCLNEDPDKRPYVQEIQQVIEEYQKRIEKITGVPIEDYPAPVDMQDILNIHLLSYKLGILCDVNGVWFSPDISRPRYVANSSLKRGILPGWYYGISGVQYILSLLTENKFDTSALKHEINTSWDWIQSEYLDQRDRMAPGLYQGGYGVAVALVAAMRADLVIKNEQTYRYLHELLGQFNNELSIGYGVSGLGLSLLYCSEYLKPKFKDSLLQHCKDHILANQRSDGSWRCLPIGGLPQEKEQLGLSYGVAGIVYFLSEYYSHLPDENVKAAVERALNWLTPKAKGSLTDCYVDSGNAGIILACLKAYEVFRIEKLNDAIKSGLEMFPKYFLADQLSLGSGMAGLGMMYLQAYRILNCQEYFDRAHHICTVLLNTSNQAQNDGLFWNTANAGMATADLLAGNGGVAYFLLHYYKPELLKTSFIF